MGRLRRGRHAGDRPERRGKRHDPSDAAVRVLEFFMACREASLHACTDAFGLTKVEAEKLMSLQELLHGKMKNYEGLMRHWADREGREEVAVENMLQCIGSIVMGEQRFIDPVIQKAIDGLPKARKRLAELPRGRPDEQRAWEEIARHLLSGTLNSESLDLMTYLRAHGSLDGARFQRISAARDFLNWQCLEITIDMVVGFEAAYRGSAIGELERFGRSLKEIALEFLGKYEKTREVLVWRQLGAFKSMTNSIALENARFSVMIGRPDSHIRQHSLAERVMDSPGLLALEDDTLQRLKAIALKIPSERIARCVIENPQWVKPPAFDDLERLIEEIGKGNGEWLRALNRQGLTTALRLARAFNENREWSGLYRKIAEAPNPLSARDFAEYVLEVGRERIGGGGTFHDRLRPLLGKLQAGELAGILLAATDLYLSGLWPTISGLLEEDGKSRKVAMAGVKEVAAGRFDKASELLQGHFREKEDRERLAVLERVQGDHGSAGKDEEDLLVRLYRHLEAAGIEGRRGVFRRHGRQAALKIAREILELDGRACKVILQSDGLRPLFAKIAMGEESEGLADRINRMLLQEGEAVDERIRLELERRAEEGRTMNEGRFGRIVLLAGEKQRAAALAARLGEATALEVKALPENPTLKELRATLRSSDAVIIVVSHLSHAAFGNAIALCRSRGIAVLIGSETNAERIAKRLQSLGPGHGTGRPS